MQAEEEDPSKHEQGLNCSSAAIYNIYMSGNRVTRNRIRKETQPPGKKKTVEVKKPSFKTVAGKDESLDKPPP